MGRRLPVREIQEKTAKTQRGTLSSNFFYKLFLDLNRKYKQLPDAGITPV
jgi:hypothetical protein